MLRRYDKYEVWIQIPGKIEMIYLKEVTCSNESQKVRDHGAMRSQQGRKPL